MENSRRGVIDAVNDSDVATVQPHVHLILCSIQVLEEVGPVV